ncbi:unnamed protein product [Closterium sp. Naga37s-1]|nr:unnamed protein product [Closterium sp. Naga37s-1]
MDRSDLLGKPVVSSGVSSSPRRASGKTSPSQTQPGSGKHAGGSKPTQARSIGKVVQVTVEDHPFSKVSQNPHCHPLLPYLPPTLPYPPPAEGIGKVVQVAVDDHPAPRKPALGTKPGASGRLSAPRATTRDARPRLVQSRGADRGSDAAVGSAGGGGVVAGEAAAAAAGAAVAGAGGARGGRGGGGAAATAQRVVPEAGGVTIAETVVGAARATGVGAAKAVEAQTDAVVPTQAVTAVVTGAAAEAAAAGPVVAGAAAAGTVLAGAVAVVEGAAAVQESERISSGMVEEHSGVGAPVEQRMQGREGEVWDTEAAASLVSPASLASPPALVSPASPGSPPSLAARPDEPLASPPPRAPGHASAGPAATSAATSAATLAATSGAELAAEDDLLMRLPKVREMHGGREEGVKRASEAAVHVPKETQLVASRNVATAMAMRAKQLQADLKAARRDAMDARERCRAVEEENERLRAALAAGEAAREGGKGEGMGEREAEGGVEGEGGVDTHHHHHHSELEDMMSQGLVEMPPFPSRNLHEQLGVLLQEKAQLVAGKAAVERENEMLQLHEQLGVLLQEKAQLVAGKAAVERENEMLHHLLLYYEHLHLHRASTNVCAHHAFPEGGHVLPEGGEHVLLAGGQHVMSAEEHAALMHEHMHLHGGLSDGHGVDGDAAAATASAAATCENGDLRNQQPGNGEAESGASDMTEEGCAGEGENREEGQEKAEEHTGPTPLQPQLAAPGLLDEAREGGWACVGKNGEEGQEKAEGHEGPPLFQQQVAAAVSLEEAREGREVCGGAEAGCGPGMVDGSSDWARMSGAVAVSGGAEEEQKGGAGSVCAGSGVDDCTGSNVYAGS